MNSDKRLWAVLPGFLIAMATGYAAFFVAGLHRGLDPLVAGIVLGMAVRLLMGKRESFDRGLAKVPGIFIPVGIIFYGVNLNFRKLNIVSFTTWLQIIIGIIIIFWLAIVLGRRLGVSDKAALLISTGTAICGASAIALMTPIVKGKSEDAGTALLTITLWGFAGIVIYPFIQRWLSISADNYALLTATTLHQTGFVKIASGALSDGCLKAAMAIKGARTAFIIPVMYILSLFEYSRDINAPRYRMPVPWFVWAFLLVGLVFSFVSALHPYVKYIKPMGTILWTMAMTGLGLTVDVRRLISKIAGPLLLGLVLWLALVANYFIGYFGMGY